MNNIGTRTAFAIFAIDGDEKENKVFRALMSQLHAAGRLKGHCIECVGSWKGVEETSYIMREDDFKEFVIAQWCKGQEAFMRITGDARQAVEMVYQGALFDRTELIGFLQQVDEATAKKQDGWTYRPDLDIYWITVKGNPDVIFGGV